MAHQPFSGSIPDDRLYCTAHDMWVQDLGGGEARVGATGFGIFLPEIIASPPAARAPSSRARLGPLNPQSVLRARARFFVLLAEEAPKRPPGLTTTTAGWMARVRRPWAATGLRALPAA
jgi:glycine cleavage system H protein